MALYFAKDRERLFEASDDSFPRQPTYAPLKLSHRREPAGVALTLLAKHLLHRAFQLHERRSRSVEIARIKIAISVDQARFQHGRMKWAETLGAQLDALTIEFSEARIVAKESPNFSEQTE